MTETPTSYYQCVFAIYKSSNYSCKKKKYSNINIFLTKHTSTAAIYIIFLHAVITL